MKLSGFCITSVIIQSATALICWQCENQPNMESCNKKGKMWKCQASQNSCQTEIRKGSFGTLVTKRCKQAMACDNNYIQNPRSAWVPTQCNDGEDSSVCRCCCTSDMCNSGEAGCLQRDLPQPPCLKRGIGIPRFGARKCDPEIKVDDLYVPPNTVCDFTCNDGYEVIGADRSVCIRMQGEGKFTEPTPRCRPINCQRLIPPDNGDVTCNDVRPPSKGTTCTFTCSSGYTLRGSQTTTCGFNGLWSNPTPVCQKIEVRCRSLKNPLNGIIQCSNENNIGSSCRFSCNSGYAIVGESSSTCGDDFNGDALGRWTNQAPVCEVETCGPSPTPPENGFAVCTGSNEASLCEFGCNSYFSRVGSIYSTCVRNSANQLIWDNSAPICQPNTCPAQILPHGQVSCTDEKRQAPTTCTFACTETDYTLFPPNVTENRCQNNSAWNIPRPCCTRLCPPYALLDFVIVLDSSSSVGSSNWVLMTTFVRDIIQQFNLGNDSARIGVFRYNRVIDTTTEVPLNRFTNSTKDLVAAFDKIPYNGRGTRTGQALEYASDTFFSSTYGNRPGVKDVLLIITDGRSQDSVAEPAKKLRDDGVLIFVIGIQPDRGSLNFEQLNEIADNPKHVYIARSFEELREFDQQITSEVCAVDPCAHDPRL